jgi:hypothetical protein
MDQSIAVFLAPWALILGGGLVATSVLSFFNHHFYKTKLLAVLAFCAGVLLLGLMELIFVSSSGYFFQAQKVVAGECELVGETAHPDQRVIKGSSEIRKAIVGCMENAGYEWVPEHRHCTEAPVPMNAYCYLPTGLFSRPFTKFQLIFE